MIEMMNKMKSLPVYGTRVNFEKLTVHKPAYIICAFPNSDTELVLKEAIIKYANEIVNGLYKLSEFLMVQEKTIIMPDQKSANAFSNFEGNVEVQEFIRVRDYSNCLFVHPVTMLNISRILDGKEPIALLQIDKYPLKEVKLDVRLDALINVDDLKGVIINHTFYDTSIFTKTIAEIENLGNGYIDVIKNTDCIVQKVTEEELNLRKRSCGICTFCREGLYQIHTVLQGMDKPGTKVEDLNLLQEIGEAMNVSCMCSVGEVAASSLLSAKKYFAKELESHCGRGSCPTNICKGFMNIYIDPHKCEGCGDCIDVCPKNCIDGKPRFISMIDDMDCDKCGKCLNVCENKAIIFTSNRVPKLPTKLTRVGKFR